MRLLAVILVLSACTLNVDYKGTNYQCNPDGSCPNGFSCESRVCVPVDPTPPACSKQVAVGSMHACAVRKDGSVWCWGRNDFGQLGDGTAIDSTVPVQVSGVGGAIQVVGGDTHSCAVDGGGSVYCWGHDDVGQLGDGQQVDAKTPVKIAMSGKAISLSSGTDHTCALMSDGSMQCWGSNDDGQLGDNTNTNRSTPAAVPGLSGITAIATGDDSTCAVDSTKMLKCWGQGAMGQIGDGMMTSRSVPTAVMGLTNIVGVAAGGGFACANDAAGAVWCWGAADHGQLGDGVSGTGALIPMPDRVLTTGPIRSLTAGGEHACGIDELDRLWCWGYDGDERLGDGTTETIRSVPTLSLISGTEVSAGGESICAVDNKGAIRCAGFNRRGVLGDGRRTSQGAPQKVPGITGATALALGYDHACVISGGVAKCWGANDDGQLGDGTNLDSSSPVEVAGLSGLTQVVAGGSHTCALSSDHLTFCWGNNNSAQLGVPGPSSPVSQWAALDDHADQLFVGDDTTCEITSNTPRCWGNQYGAAIADPAGAGFTDIVQMSVGGGHSCVLHMGGNLECFGSDSDGQLGLGTSGGGNGTPTTPMNIGTVTQVSLRGDDTCALIGDGTVQCMGYGGDCQLGNGGCSTENVLPQQVQGLTQAVELATGWNQSCARRMDGGVWCWGVGYNGAVGDGAYTTRKMASSLPALTGGVMHVASGGNHACVLMADGTVECWGIDTRGQLGDGITASDHPVGVQMPCPE